MTVPADILQEDPLPRGPRELTEARGMESSGQNPKPLRIMSLLL
jgi:hypothetical protein